MNLYYERCFKMQWNPITIYTYMCYIQQYNVLHTTLYMCSKWLYSFFLFYSFFKYIGLFNLFPLRSWPKVKCVGDNYLVFHLKFFCILYVNMNERRIGIQSMSTTIDVDSMSRDVESTKLTDRERWSFVKKMSSVLFTYWSFSVEF